jgi:hypothetical protein
MIFHLQKVLGRKECEPVGLAERCLLQLYSKT